MATTRCVFVHDLDLPAGHSCRPHAHEATEFVLSQACSGRLHQRGVDYGYDDATVFVYQPGASHWIENERAGRQTCIGVIGLGSADIPEGVYDVSKEIVRIFASVQESVRRSRYFDEERLDLYAGLITLGLAEHICEPRPERTKAQRVRDIIDTEFAMDWDVASLAREVYVSPDYLRQLFRVEYGEPVIHYLIGKRIAYAKALLRETDDPIGRIAEASGFQDPYYFSRVFRKHTGCSPTDFRAGATGTRRS
ncbi:MAG: helix-turn-helix transcriptional regulator [Spirochaetota bacterium]